MTPKFLFVYSLPLHCKLLKAHVHSIHISKRSAYLLFRTLLREKNPQNLTDDSAVNHRKPFTIKKKRSYF